MIELIDTAITLIIIILLIGVSATIIKMHNSYMKHKPHERND